MQFQPRRHTPTRQSILLAITPLPEYRSYAVLQRQDIHIIDPTRYRAAIDHDLSVRLVDV
jgi:hypothetical protein